MNKPTPLTSAICALLPTFIDRFAKVVAAASFWVISPPEINATRAGMPPAAAIKVWLSGWSAMTVNAFAASLANLAANPVNQVLIAAMGAISLLVSLVQNRDESHKEAGAAGLMSLADNVDNQVLVATSGAIPPLVSLVREGTNLQKVHAGHVLQVLSLHAKNRFLIAAAGGIATLLELMRNGNEPQKLAAIRAVANLSVVGTSNSRGGDDFWQTCR